MGDQDHRAGVFVEGVQQGPAAVDVEVVGRFVEDQDVRRIHGHLIEQQAGALAAGQAGDGGLLLLIAQTPLGQFGAAAALRGLGHGASDDLQRRVGRVHGLDLVLVEPADAHLSITMQFAVRDVQRPGDHLGEGRLARAVDAQQADAVVQVHAQVEVPQDRPAGLITDIGAFQPDQRWGQGARRGGQDEGGDPFLDGGGDGLHLGQTLHPGLGLGGLGGLGLETVDEGLEVSALGILFGLGRQLQPGLLGAGLFELVVVARVEGQVAVREVQDVGADLIQHLSVVGDDQGGVRVFLEPRLEPQRTFQVEIVGRFVEQQHVRLGEQGRSEGHPHTPAAGVFRHRPQLVVMVEAEADEDFGGPGRGGVGVDLDQPGPDLAHLLGLGGLQPAQQAVAFLVSLEDGLEHADGGGRVFLVDGADAGRLRQADLVAAGGQFTEDQLEQGRFADAVAADQPDLGTGRQGDGGILEEFSAPGVEGQVGDLEHGAGAKLCSSLRQRTAAP